MHALSLSFLSRFRDAAPVVLRVVIGVIMATHGWQKLTAMGPANFGGGMLDPLGVPAPLAVAWLVTFIELAGGILLIVGLFTRLSGVLLAAVLVGATLLVKVDIGLIAPMGADLPGAELDLALLAGLVGILVLGSGKPSVDHMLGIEEDVHVDDHRSARVAA